MPKIPSISSKKFCKLLERVGCILDRVEGDHYVYVKNGIVRPIVVPLRKQLPVFIILNNLKTLGMPRKEFLQHLKDI